jgi:hypothetical protein
MGKDTTLLEARRHSLLQVEEHPWLENPKYKMLQNLKLFEGQYGAISEKYPPDFM